MNEWSFASNKVCGIKSKALLKSVVTVPTTEFLHLELSHEPWGAYHLIEKSGWGVESIMVSHLPVYRRNATSVTV